MEILTLTILTLDLAGNGGPVGEEEACYQDGVVSLEEVKLCKQSESGEDRSGDGEGDDFEKRWVVGLKDQERV